MRFWIVGVMLAGCGTPPLHVSKQSVVATQPPPKPARLDAVHPPAVGGAQPAPILVAMGAELDRSMTELKKHADAPYFASYEVTEYTGADINAELGALASSKAHHYRSVDVDVRVGDYKLDNRHPVRGRQSRGDQTLTTGIPIEDDDFAVRTILWRETDRAYKRAAEQLQKVEANSKVKTEAEDLSDDFSHETPSQYYEAPATITIDRAQWEARLRQLSGAFQRYPEVTTSSVWLSTRADTVYFASSDGTRYQTTTTHLRLTISATTTADDGMELHRTESFDASSPAELPTDEQIEAKIANVATDLVALRKAPLGEPYLGPAILEGKAAGVFFHEVFGHRIEGHRQKNEDEGQTFAKKINQPIMPDFIDVYDDPSIATLNGIELNGFYRYDNEGVTGQRASLVEHGVLRTFLLGRTPTRGFVKSNGHGRRSGGNSVVSRQGNLVVAASRTVDRATLKNQLLDLVKQQGKPYGLLFRELDGGFTMTRRFEPQSFKLLPIMVYRIYPDGHEELIRGADLEGTPLRALADITAAGDDVETFNGYCGAESGYVPVSATSPSLLIAHVEVAKKSKSSEKPPILPAPPAGGDR